MNYNPLNEVARLSIRVHLVQPKEALAYVDKGILDCISQMRKRGARTNPDRMDKLHARLVRLEKERERILHQIASLPVVQRKEHTADRIMREDMKKSERQLRALRA